MVSALRRTDPKSQTRTDDQVTVRRNEEKNTPAVRARLDNPTPSDDIAARPLNRPTRDTARTAQARLNGDSGAGFRALQLNRALDTRQADGVVAFHHSEPEVVPAHHPTPTDPTNPTPGTSTSPTRTEIDEAIEAANDSGDMDALNEVDPFRESLPPELQERYDRELEELRGEVRSDENPEGRVNFIYEDGATRDPAVEDLALRGMVAGSFGQPSLLETALDKGAEGDNGALDVHISGERDLNGDEDGSPIGYAHRDADMTLSRDGFLDSIAGGRNTAMHEFTHIAQLGGDPDSNFDGFGILPPNATPEQVEEFTGLFLDAYHPKGGASENDDTVHYFTTAQNDFRLHPEELKARSPELYDWMVDYTGQDPLAGTVRPTIGEIFSDALDRLGDIFGGNSDNGGGGGGGGGRSYAI